MGTSAPRFELCQGDFAGIHTKAHLGASRQKLHSAFWLPRTFTNFAPTKMSSRPEDFHLQALPEPCMTLSSHTAPDVRPFP